MKFFSVLYLRVNPQSPDYIVCETTGIHKYEHCPLCPWMQSCHNRFNEQSTDLRATGALGQRPKIKHAWFILPRAKTPNLNCRSVHAIAAFIPSNFRLQGRVLYCLGQPLEPKAFPDCILSRFARLLSSLVQFIYLGTKHGFLSQRQPRVTERGLKSMYETCGFILCHCMINEEFPENLETEATFGSIGIKSRLTLSLFVSIRVIFWYYTISQCTVLL